MRAINASGHGVDLDSGRVLVPGEHAHIEDSERHTDLVNAGLLVLVADEEPEPDEPESEPAPAASPTSDTKPTARRAGAKQAKES